MSTYIKPGKAQEYENAPDWLVAYMRYRRTMQGNTPKSVITDFITLREYFQWLHHFTKSGSHPKNEAELREVNILDMDISEVVEVKRKTIETYLYFCADTLNNGETTRTKKLMGLRSFYNYILDQEDALNTGLEYNPAERIPVPKAPKKQPIYLSDDECKALLDAIDGDHMERDYAIIFLLLTCGLRVSEAVSLNMGDVNLDVGTIKVHGKGNKERTAHITPLCTDAMRYYLTAYRDLTEAEKNLDSPFFISRRTRKRLTTRTVERIMQQSVLKAGLGGMGYTPHKLRHTTATMLAKDGHDLLVIQNVMGHESPTTTQIYAHLGSDDIEKAISNSTLQKLGG